jgi:GH25 family lysozyme M1 (1,4-beta-N-acetylmuramidase)
MLPFRGGRKALSVSRLRSAILILATLLAAAPAFASDKVRDDFSAPWARADRALVVDAYEYNPIDWAALATDKRIVGFINKASDGLSPPYACTGSETEQRLCKALWRRHAVARELFHTRRTVARALGLKWGAYHLGRPGNPIDQANNFLDFAQPQPDELIAIDIEENDPSQFMSLEDAEAFARHIHRRIGRFPVLYTNGSTAQHIADNRERYTLLSRLPLWYARYKPEIGMHFPKGNWQSYALWQFSSQANCNASRCPYRVPGTQDDIDVNVASMDAEALRKEWPFTRLLDNRTDIMARIPLPSSRSDGVAGPVMTAFAAVEEGGPGEKMEVALRVAGERYPARVVSAVQPDRLATGALDVMRASAVAVSFSRTARSMFHGGAHAAGGPVDETVMD